MPKNLTNLLHAWKNFPVFFHYYFCTRLHFWCGLTVVNKWLCRIWFAFYKFQLKLHIFFTFFCFSSAHNNSRYRKFYWFVCSSKMADDEQFSLCWNNFNTNLSAGFHESLCRGDLVDVSLAAEGQIVKAHRLVLSVCSPFFRKMFTQMPSNTHAIGKYYEPNGVAMPD